MLAEVAEEAAFPGDSRLASLRETEIREPVTL
jgi:hypothetical protein